MGPGLVRPCQQGITANADQGLYLAVTLEEHFVAQDRGRHFRRRAIGSEHEYLADLVGYAAAQALTQELWLR